MTTFMGGGGLWEPDADTAGGGAAAAPEPARPIESSESTPGQPPARSAPQPNLELTLAWDPTIPRALRERLIETLSMLVEFKGFRLVAVKPDGEVVS